MAENVKIDLQNNAAHRVALDLAIKIGYDEQNHGSDPRAYWLKLYAQCRSVVVDGWAPQEALKL